MPYQLPDGQVVSDSMPFVLNEVQYPENWIRLSSPEELEALGIEVLPDPPVWDQRFYLGYDEAGALIPMDHAMLVERWAATTRTNANTLLAPTDWLVLREADTGTPMDPQIRATRAAIRTAAAEKVTAIEATANTDELASLVTASEYHQWPTETIETAAPDWSAFYQGLLIQPAFGHIRTVAATSVEVAVAYADAAIALSQAAIQRVNVPAIQASLDNLLGLMNGEVALLPDEKTALELLVQNCGLEDTITLTFAS